MTNEATIVYLEINKEPSECHQSNSVNLSFNDTNPFSISSIWVFVWMLSL